jgi:hypothetical protein
MRWLPSELSFVINTINNDKDNGMEQLKQQVIDSYKECYSVSSILRDHPDLGRRRVEGWLKEAGIYEGMTGPNAKAAKHKAMKQGCLDKYGVENPGQLPGQGWSLRNNVPYTRISFLDNDFKKYVKEVGRLSYKTASKLEKPKYCYYTGIMFADEQQELVNHNDPRKRSLDHKLPSIICYYNGIDASLASSIDNLVFVLRYVNTIKGNTLHESFISIAPKIRKAFINEGFKSN